MYYVYYLEKQIKRRLSCKAQASGYRRAMKLSDSEIFDESLSIENPRESYNAILPVQACRFCER